MRQLQDCGVVFQEVDHTYTLGDKTLQGITKRIQQRLFPDEFANIPQAVLDAAADRGHVVHEVIMRRDQTGEYPTFDEVLARPALSALAVYEDAREKTGLHTEYNEHPCTDGHTYATCIDAVMSNAAGEVILADYKTVSKLNVAKVAWQLSTEAYFLEKNNPGLKVGGLYAVWLEHTGEVFHRCTFVEVSRVPAEQVERMLYTDEPLGEMAVTSSMMPAKWARLEAAIIEIDEQVKKWTEKKKELTDGILQEMVKAGAYKWVAGRLEFTRRKETTRRAIDTKALKAERPDIYEKYLKESPVTASVTIKIKDNG